MQGREEVSRENRSRGRESGAGGKERFAGKRGGEWRE